MNIQRIPNTFKDQDDFDDDMDEEDMKPNKLQQEPMKQ